MRQKPDLRALQQHIRDLFCEKHTGEWIESSSHSEFMTSLNKKHWNIKVVHREKTNGFAGTIYEMQIWQNWTSITANKRNTYAYIHTFVEIWSSIKYTRWLMGLLCPYGHVTNILSAHLNNSKCQTVNPVYNYAAWMSFSNSHILYVYTLFLLSQFLFLSLLFPLSMHDVPLVSTQHLIFWIRESRRLPVACGGDSVVF